MIALLILPSLVLILFGFVPRQLADRQGWLVRWAPRLAASQLLLTILGAAYAWSVGPEVFKGSLSGAAPGFSGWAAWLAHELAIQPDALQMTMLLLVSFVGWTIASYSTRYLDGDPHQGSYFKWVSVTVGAVCLMSVAGSLLLFAIAWALGSIGIHHLLLHFPERVGARQAAWTKFTFSRAGDLAMLIAICLVLASTGSTRFETLLASEGMKFGQAVGWLVVIAACLKSAQFPFHTWLPQTVETPTPVSALMHAGIVNAGGYLLVRLGPFLTNYPATLLTLACIGTVTAVLAGMVMMTQSSIKRSLAYSTVAQMGFMMLQCGLGAFSAAFLHILAHSLYKAHAFLSSGSVVSEAAGQQYAVARNRKRPTGDREDVGLRTLPQYLFSALAVASIIAVCLMLTGINPSAKSGGWVVVGVIWLALVSGVWQTLRSRQAVKLWPVLSIATCLTLVYLVSYLLVDRIVPAANLNATLASSLVFSGVLVLFLTLFGLHQWWMAAATTGRQRAWQAALYVHALNGFYVEVLWRKWLRLDTLREPTQPSSLG